MNLSKVLQHTQQKLETLYSAAAPRLRASSLYCQLKIVEEDRPLNKQIMRLYNIFIQNTTFRSSSFSTVSGQLNCIHIGVGWKG